MLERIIIFIGAIVFTYLGVQEARIYYYSSGNKPHFIELDNISDNSINVKWVTIGKHYVDWRKAQIKYKEDSSEKNKEISSVWYILQNTKLEIDFNNKGTVVVCSFKYKNKEDLPTGIKKVKSISGIFTEHLREFNGETLKKLEINYPGLDSSGVLLLYEGKEPRLFYAWFMMGAGVLCSFLTLLFLYWQFFTDRNRDESSMN